tara:strand:- start:2487 stop:3314 length:828 start_codon:yes stop_codon:yes gene_type:complete
MKIILTLTTIPSRLNTPIHGELGIKSNLLSLLNQSYKDYEIHLNIPSHLKLTGEEYIIPEWVKDLSISNPKFKIFDKLEDIGPSTKLIPTIQRLSNPEDIIIVVDDDLVYHKDLVKEQILNQSTYPESIVGYDGLRSKSNHFKDIRDYYYTSNSKNDKVDILQHYKSVSYKRRYFEDDFLDFTKENFTWEDDLLLAAYFSYKKRDRLATFHKSDPVFNSLEEWQERGGVTTFPVLRHTNHEQLEGCNLFRSDEKAAKTHITDLNLNLYKYIDNGY